MESKKCRKCGENKELSEFSKDATKKDCKNIYCKICSCEYVRNWTRRNKKRVLEVSREWKAKNKEKVKGYQLKHRDDFPLKHQARGIVTRAIISGRLIKMPCEVCGIEENVEAHHENYSEPLCIKWYCKEHHGIAHRRYA